MITKPEIFGQNPCNRCCGTGKEVDVYEFRRAVKMFVGMHGRDNMMRELGVNSLGTFNAYMCGARVWPDHVVKKVVELMKGL